MEIPFFPKYEVEDLFWKLLPPLIMAWYYVSAFSTTVSLNRFANTKRDSHCTIFSL